MALSVLLYETEINTLLALPEEQRGHILTAILCAATGKELPDLDSMENAVFTLVNAQVKRAAATSEKRKQSANSRWKNQANEESEDTQEQSETAPQIQNSNEGMQSNANAMQNQANEESGDKGVCTYTSTNTITNTSTNTITGTNTSTSTETAPAPETDSKPKKPKKSVPEKKRYADFVTLTEEEHAKLVEKYGEAAVQWCIEKLDNYKGSTGRRYASDYRTILSWVMDSYQEEQAKHRQQTSIRPPGGGTQGQPLSKNPFLNAVINDSMNNGRQK